MRLRASEVNLPLVVSHAHKGDEGESSPLSIHDKWASPQFKEIADSWSLDYVERVGEARTLIADIKSMYRKILSESSPSPLQLQVMDLLNTGTLVSVSGGKGGVYFLLDSKGLPKFVLKPGDESNLAINNNKMFASPFLDGEGISPVKGICIYEAVQNAELSSFAAELFGLQDITPHTEVMIIEHPIFHDLLDGTSEYNTPRFKKLDEKTPASKEKVCSVQPFIKGCVDIGSLLCAKSNLEPEEIKRLLKEKPEEYEILEKKHTPQDIDQGMYEKIAIFSFIIGEKDGNAGNLICTEVIHEGIIRLIFKIDNSATFPETNEGLRTGLCWAVHNYSKELSLEARTFIQKIEEKQIEVLKNQMRLRGKSETSIKAMEERIKFLKEYEKLSTTIEDLDSYLMAHEW